MVGTGIERNNRVENRALPIENTELSETETEEFERERIVRDGEEDTKDLKAKGVDR